MAEQARYWVGIDWAWEEHQVCVIDATGAVIEERKVDHSGEGLAGLADWLLKLADGNPEHIVVAIERPDSAVVETLLERKIVVCAINPKQLDRFRDRHSVSGAKGDVLDAFVLADSLRTDRALYRAIQPDDAEILQLREASRMMDELNESFGAVANRLREQLNRFYPQMLRLNGVDEAWCWDLLEIAPTPRDACKLRGPRVAAVLKKHRIRRINATEVISTLATAPLIVAAGVTEAAVMHVASLIRQLRCARAEILACKKEIERLVEGLRTPVKSQPVPEASGEEPPLGQRSEHRDAAIILSLPGVGMKVVAALLGEASRHLTNRDYQGIRLRSGVAPVTKQTGKQRQRGSRKKRPGTNAPPPKVEMRRACNHTLRNALYHMASTASNCDPRWHALYTDARGRGVTHGGATRIVADRMLATLITMLRTGTLYDPTRYGRVQPVPEVTKKAA